VKKKVSASVVGRKLRHVLGSLLTIGFGVTWWSFVPVPSVDSPGIPSASTPESVSIRWSTTSDLPPAPLVAMNTPRPHHPRPRPPELPPVGDPDPVVDPPVVDPTIDPPVIDPDPVVDPPVVDPDPVVVVDPVDLPPIITRSS